MIYDITRLITQEISVWPGDTRFSAVQQMNINEGASVNLFTLTFSAHTGTHMDAYHHFDAEPIHPAQMPLDAYVGRARVVTVDKRDGPLLPSDFAEHDFNGAERILIHSHVSDLPNDEWATDFPYLSPELIKWLSDYDIKLIGLDSPSVDAFDSTDLPSHHALKQHNIVNLENLLLCDVPDGDYELIALPLKLDGVCGSPVRAILRTL
jgi:arylformamidase